MSNLPTERQPAQRSVVAIVIASSKSWNISTPLQHQLSLIYVPTPGPQVSPEDKCDKLRSIDSDYERNRPAFREWKVATRGPRLLASLDFLELIEQRSPKAAPNGGSDE